MLPARYREQVGLLTKNFNYRLLVFIEWYCWQDHVLIYTEYESVPIFLHQISVQNQLATQINLFGFVHMQHQTLLT